MSSFNQNITLSFEGCYLWFWDQTIHVRLIIQEDNGGLGLVLVTCQQHQLHHHI